MKLCAKLLCLLVTLLLLFPLCLSSCGAESSELPDDTAVDGSEALPFENKLFYSLAKAEGKLDLVMFRVGHADAMLVSTQNYNILIDTGERNDDDAKKILAYLETQNITHLDAVIVSNLLTDNIGGLEQIADSVTIDRVIEPAYNPTGHRYTKYLRIVTKTGAELLSLTKEAEFVYDDLTIRCYPAKNPQIYQSEDDMSLVLTLTHGANTFLFTSTIGEARLGEVMQTLSDPVTVVKMPNHGVWFEGVEDFLTQYAPKYALISDSLQHEVSYDMLSLLADRNITYYRTKEAYICIRSDGKRLNFEQN